MRGTGGLGGHAVARAVENVTAESGDLGGQPVVDHVQWQAWWKRRSTLSISAGTLEGVMGNPHTHTHTPSYTLTPPTPHRRRLYVAAFVVQCTAVPFMGKRSNRTSGKKKRG